MRMLVAALMAVTTFPGGASADPLSHFIDHARVLIISAPAASDPDLRRQEHELSARRAGMEERALVVVRVIGDQAADTRRDRLDAAGVRHAVGLPVDHFGVVLVGKDGGVKLRRRQPITAAELFFTIDAMPMRQAEMRRRR